MAYAVNISIEDRATSLLAATQAKLAPATVAKVSGRAGQQFTRKHFFDLNKARPNKLGGARTNFYAQAARGTTFTSDATGALVSVNQVGIRQRIQGGTILPKKGKFLTIPAQAVAHGKRAREFGDLKFAVVEIDGRHRRALVKEGASEEFWGEDDVIFWLVPRVVQKADASVMPDLGKMADHIVLEIGKLIRIREAKLGGAA